MTSDSLAIDVEMPVGEAMCCQQVAVPEMPGRGYRHDGPQNKWFFSGLQLRTTWKGTEPKGARHTVSIL